MTNIETKRTRWTAIIFIVVVQIFLSYTSKTVAVNAFVTKTISTLTSTSTLLHPKSSSSSSSSVAGLTILPSLPQSYTSTTVGRASYTKGTTTTTARQQSKQSSTMILLQHKHQHTHQLHQLQKNRRLGGVGLFSTTAADAENETELPLPSAVVTIEEEVEEEEQSHDNNGRKKKKIELMIDKIERKYLSSSRLLRLLFYPLRLLIWKPLRMLMEIFIDRSDKDGNMVVDNTSASTSSSSSSVVDVEDKIAVVTTSDTDTIVTSSSSVAEVEDNIPVTTTSDTDIIDATSVPTASTTSSSDDVGADVGADIGADVVVTCPIGDRWAISAPGIDLSGKWELIITKEFKKEYDVYLGRLGQPKLVRSVALSAPVIGKTFEELIQTDSGRSLFIHGVNIRGTWDRTLVTSGTSLTDNDFIPLQVPITTVDSEPVEAESWWEDQGRVHMSYLRGVTMYGGGSFVSRRYFEEKNEDEDVVYACESSFVFNDTKKEPNSLTWRFHRQKE